MNDLELLRRHEPILRFTAGELFFPCAVDGYVRECSLWRRGRDGRSKLVVDHGALDLETLAERSEAPHGHALYLRFVDKPLTALQYQQWLRRPRRVRFHAPGRLARVPPWSRMLDSAFDLSLLVRGAVPGGTTAAAQLKYAGLQARDHRSVYYGRVVRDGGWTVLHYLFFYPMNDWRSTFHGANDHEADWEQIFVYLYERDGVLEPRWAAYASHDYTGDDLRRRWDDPLLKKEGLHPVVFAAAGSHSSYFEQGEYVMRVEPGFLKPVKRAANTLRRFWAESLRQGFRVSTDRKMLALVSVPFVDYARGDGVAIGPGGHHEWSPVLISDGDTWVERYQGLWGLDTRDPFSGERAPAGPRYNRDGSVRLSWYDPLGWAGLDKVLPPTRLAPALEARQNQLALELAELDSQVEQRRQAVQAQALDEAARRTGEDIGSRHAWTGPALSENEAELFAMKARRDVTSRTRQAVAAYAERIRAGASDDPRAHLHHVRHPDPPRPPRRVLQVWAAVSGGVALLAVVAVLLVLPAHRWFWATVIGIAFATMEAVAEGRLLNFLLTVTVILAVISALVLIWEFWRLLIVGTLGVLVCLMIRDNLRELVRQRVPREK